MISFYFFSVLLGIVYFFNQRLGFILLVGGCIFFLITLPSTGIDYVYYEQAYNNAYFIETFPWFKSDTILTSEPLYIWYTSLLGVLFPFSFPFFLAFNFIVCVLLSFSIFKFFQNSYLHYFWIMLLPVIFPTLFYFSPRSSLSFFFVLAGFIYIIHGKYKSAILFLFLSIMLHSQFILIGVLILLTYYLFNNFNIKNFERTILILSVVLFLLLSFIDQLIFILRSILEFLPTAQIATSKLRLLTDTKSGLRITSILSIIIYPVMAYILVKRIKTDDSLYILKNKKNEVELAYMLLAIMCYGAVINLVFITEPHLAGRLSRFSDYLGMGFLIPAFLKIQFGNNIEKIVWILLVVSAPLLYSTLYHNEVWGF